MEERALRYGFTTGTCGAGAAFGAASMLLGGRRLEQVNIMTPKGTEAVLPLFHVVVEDGKVSCAVKKDAGDDPDVTDGTLVFASVEYCGKEPEGCYRWEPEGEAGLYLTAGRGIGRVTKPGLSCPVGMPAVNPVPRQMIFEWVGKAREAAACKAPLLITVWIPDGERLAEKTFNPKLGIVGGLSVLGTSGVVEPMSEAALRETIALEIHMKAAEGQRRLILTPGNYGEAFLRDSLGLSLDRGVKCSNFLRDAFETAGREGMEEILLVGHLGKLIKTAGGIPNTHSKYGDHRMEILWDIVMSVWKGAVDQELPCRILGSNTTEEAVEVLEEYGIRGPVMAETARRVKHYGQTWSGRRCRVETVIFTLNQGILGMSEGAEELINRLGGQMRTRPDENTNRRETDR